MQRPLTVAALALTGCTENSGSSEVETRTEHSTTEVTEGSAVNSGNDSGHTHAAPTSGKPGDKVALAPLAKPLVTPGEANTPQPESASQPGGENQAVPDSSGLQGNIPWTESSLDIPADFYLEDVRAAEHESYDRVVIELSGKPSVGTFIKYTDEPAQQGTGDIEPVKGNAYLYVVLRGWLAKNNPDGPALVKHGSLGVRAGVITDVYYSGEFEADSVFFIGLDREREYKVQKLQNPPRLVIDFIK